jgi:hypothetical protein
MFRGRPLPTPNPNDLLQRVEAETLKFMDIATIYQKLCDQGILAQLYKIFYQIFSSEHEYTMAGMCKKVNLLYFLFVTIDKIIIIKKSWRSLQSPTVKASISMITID